MTKEEFVSKYGDDSIIELKTIEQVKNWRNKIEDFTGIECINLAQLGEDANVYDYNDAKSMDVSWFKGFANDLLLML